MAIQSIANLSVQQAANLSEKKNVVSSSDAQSHFGKLLKNALDEVNQAQIESDKITQRLALGDSSVQLHDVMIAAQKASITLNATLEIRNKVVEAYQEMMRMQI